MKSPNGKFETVCTNYGEVRMGSPLFGSIEIRGLKRQFEERLFGEAMAFSPDSRYFAISELVDGGRNGPVSRVVVVELRQGYEYIATPSSPGLIRSVAWKPEDKLSIVHWQHPYGETNLSWSPPSGA
ncbi:hypothetical protein [Lacunisphaera limnophila]|uniref:hypothetical protein n=1 Tax=Lacunisphaera limnophila TaxID=1838286 RepID=UPI0012FD4E7F|nr:hypothetical protein [Lacunisphaera limnophila]